MVSPRRRSQPIYEILVWRTYDPDPLAWLPGDALLAMNGLPIIVLSLVGQIATRMHNPMALCTVIFEPPTRCTGKRTPALTH